MTAGRPKSDNPKSHVTSVRLTQEQREEIILLFGSIQAFLDQAIIKEIKKKTRRASK